MIVRVMPDFDLMDGGDFDPRVHEGPSHVRLAYTLVRRIVAEGFDVSESSFL
jgi:hypothetical protein